MSSCDHADHADPPCTCGLRPDRLRPARMTRVRRRGLVSVALIAALVLFCGTANALAVVTPTISLRAASTSVTAGTMLKLSGRVSHAAAGVTSVTILRRARGRRGSAWRRRSSPPNTPLRRA